MTEFRKIMARNDLTEEDKKQTVKFFTGMINMTSNNEAVKKEVDKD